MYAAKLWASRPYSVEHAFRQVCVDSAFITVFGRVVGDLLSSMFDSSLGGKSIADFWGKAWLAFKFSLVNGYFWVLGERGPG